MLKNVCMYVCLLLVVSCFPFSGERVCNCHAAEADLSLEDVPSDKIDSVLARLSDEQIRSLLITELQKEGQVKNAAAIEGQGLYATLKHWLHAIDTQGDGSDVGVGQLLVHLKMVPGDVARTLGHIGGGSLLYFLGYLFLIAAAFAGGAGAELFFKHLTRKATVRLPEVSADEEESRLWAALINVIPALVQIVVFAFVAMVIFLLVDLDDEAVRRAFMAVLLTLVMARMLILVSLFLCSPQAAQLRLFPIGDELARGMHLSIRFLVWYVSCSVMFLALIGDLGALPETRRSLGAVLGTVLFLLLAIRLLGKKNVVATAIRGDGGDAESSLVRQQVASFWHILAMLYLFIIWVIWISTLAAGAGRDNGALFISLLIVPIYLLLERIGQWLVASIVNTLGIARSGEDEEKLKERQGENYISPEEKEARLHKRLLKVFRLFIALMLTVWLLALWGFDFPFAVHMVGAAFDILVTLTLALFIWRFISRFIERKLAESMPEEEEEEEEEDPGEFGSAKQRGRSYTLLPMLRKFVATTMVVMVTLIVLSSIGVDIGPLLAGAGVIGLAVGFGAQKLVGDVLSGIFYLLDDAFRVGEYITAGAVSGSVEAITLRNVMLRHHRGMLQIVPHSDLGSITNYMRGGIVVKFNLEFPYDTDVDQVRKVIKKVGIAMLADEELGDDFILPVKSQGVREITNLCSNRVLQVQVIHYLFSRGFLTP